MAKLRVSALGLRPQSLLSPCITMTLREVEAPRGQRASPIVLHFKTDKHLLIRAGQRPLFLRKKWGKVVPTSAMGQKDFSCCIAYILEINGVNYYLQDERTTNIRSQVRPIFR